MGTQQRAHLSAPGGGCCLPPPTEAGRPADVAGRALDVVGASVGLALSAPLMLAAAVVVRLHLGPPVLFRHVRCGLGERPFVLLKFRTMRPPQGDDGRPVPRRERLTRTGRLLRQLSIDELPQLWNVLRGDMSLVGPRPLYLEYLPWYSPRERIRHRVRPGLTGLAQVAGRNRAGWDHRLETDARYVERRSLALDLSILLRTVVRVLQRRDVLEAAAQGSLAAYRQRAQRAEGGP